MRHPSAALELTGVRTNLVALLAIAGITLVVPLHRELLGRATALGS